MTSNQFKAGVAAKEQWARTAILLDIAKQWLLFGFRHRSAERRGGEGGRAEAPCWAAKDLTT